MKLKTICIIFNALIVLSFLFVVMMPVVFLGWAYAATFWGQNWYLIVLFVAVLAALNAYFIRNWRLFRALEREEWNEVIDVLEGRLVRRPSVATIKMMAHACTLTSRLDRIVALEAEVEEKRPKILPRVAMVLSIPHLLSGDGVRIVAYFDRRQRETPDSPWIVWGHAFGLMLQDRLDDARQRLQKMAGKQKPGLLLGLSAYLLGAWDNNAEESIADRYRRVIRGRYDRSAWRKLVDRERSELHVLVLSSLLGDVEKWIYDDQESAS